MNDGGPAFPEHHYFDPGRGQYGMHMTASDVGCGGMSLRDWFAGMALSGLLASGHFTKRNQDGSWMSSHEDPYDDESGEKIHHRRRRFDFPEAAWRCADEMLAARERKEEA